jgi:mannose-1-phosphate guanylyltransferase
VLWPASRENWPKQFLPLFGALSTFQDTMRRVADPALFARLIVVTNGRYRFLIAEQLNDQWRGIFNGSMVMPIRFEWLIIINRRNQ